MSDRILAHLQCLVGERHPVTSPSALQQAEHYLAEQFRTLGLDVSLHAFEALGGTYRNVIATLPPSRSSSVPPQPPLIIAAHYDTVQGSPGADDNASGLAVMLEVARRLRDVPLNGAVRFIAFCLEEEDLLGSLVYVSHLKATDQEIRGAIVLECVGFTRTEEGSQLAPPGLPIAVPTTGNFLGIVGNRASAGLATLIEHAANQRVPDLKTVSFLVPGQGESFPDTRRSDHAAFWQHGYPAVMLTDTANFRNPHYHRPTDTLDTLDLAFVDQVACAVAEAVRHLAGTDAGQAQ
ncbi:MAG: M20/M25/M40 family metallo-hydrolase [Nitrospiraceae bacterium]